MQKDPLIYFDGMNDYVYVKNRVLIFRDIFGLTCDIDDNKHENFCNNHPVVCSTAGLGLGALALSGNAAVAAASGVGGIALGGYAAYGSFQQGDYGNAAIGALGVVTGVVGIGALIAGAPAVALGAGIVGLAAGGISFFNSLNPPSPSQYDAQYRMEQHIAEQAYIDFLNSPAWH